MNSIKTLRLTVPLGCEAHVIACQFAAEQATPRKGKQTYLNTLAVYAVHSYLKWLQIDTNLSQGDSWHSGKRALFDVADLVLPGIGKLECRPVLPGKTTINLPPEVTADRIGYVAVQFSESLNEAQLLGFIKAVNISNATDQILIAELQPLDVLLNYIPDAQPVLSTSKIRVNLSHWLQNTFEAGWQTVEALLRTEAINPAFSVRSIEQLQEINPEDLTFSVSAGKVMDLGVQLAGHQVVLIVAIAPSSAQKMNIRVQLCPTGEQIYLPPSLQLSVFDASGNTSPELEAQARSVLDNWIQLEFSGELGEQFSVKVRLGDVSITEDFTI